ncbi:arginine--tRNA ligase [bacterium]|nr:MAG: arginine--tRNA ligase [bacterium]
MKKTLTDLIVKAHRLAVSKGELPDGELPAWKIELPKNPEHGDYAANIAMTLAGAAKLPPRKVAQLLLDNLSDPEGVLQSFEIAGPGFINFRFRPARWQEVVRDIEREGEKFGHSGAGKGKRVQVEFVSANPTGPLHVGHGRGAAVGDILAKIMSAAGYRVDKEYYINDAGNQIATLGGSVYLRYLEQHGRQVSFPENFYQGEYIKEIARDKCSEEGGRYLEMEEAEAIDALGRYAGARILREIKEDLERFGVTFDNWYSERSLYESGEVARVLKELEESGAAYRQDGALWLRTSAYGDEKDRVMVRADGRETYFASDIAYHFEKFRRGYDEVVDIWGADHHGYIPRIKAALKASGRDPEALHVLMVQLVNLLREGKPVSMSTRSGEFVTLQEVYEEVGVDAARFLFLTRSSDTTLDFDIEVAKRQTADNPVFYVQYANARIRSVLREAKTTGIEVPGAAAADLSPLVTEDELEIIKFLHYFPEVVEGAALYLEPHKVAYYLQDLAARFHQYYNKHRFLVDDQKLCLARLCLISAISRVIVNGLALLGVSSPESM